MRAIRGVCADSSQATNKVENRTALPGATGCPPPYSQAPYSQSKPRPERMLAG